ncbi:MAG TPA: ATP synthase F1 subunit gamma [Thermoanaerobaculia bacterium]|nr:ATP synthase F1 subunit gamma [Thermoanaerobaculia bacterium]
MPSTIDIRRRIRSVRNTQQITKAMKMVAAAKLRRAQERMLAARPYAAALLEVLTSVASRVEVADHPLLRVRPEERVLLIVVTADKGLCGGFNANVTRGTQATLRDRDWNQAQLLLLGRKGADYFKRRTVPIRHQAINIFQALSADTAHEIASLIIQDYAEEKIDAVYVIYNEFKSVIQQNLRVDRLLPFHRLEDETVSIDYLYEPGPAEILNELLPKHIEFQLYRVLLESAAAEQGARMAAMDAASKNAGDMIDSLTLTYNRIRQAAITKEIIEIVSGAAALG